MDTQPQILELIFNTISDKSVDRSTALLSTRNLINSSSQENINSSEPDTAALKHLLNLLKQNAFNEALEFGNALLPTFNESPLLLNLLGNAYQAVNNLNLAIEKFDKATELRPNFFDAHFNLANACASKGMFIRALESYYLALTIRPNEPYVLNNAGNVFLSLKKYREAITLYESCIEIKPNFVDPYTNLSVLSAEKGNLRQAVAYSKKALQMSPSSVKINFNLGLLQKRQSKYREAIQLFENTIEIAPRFSQSYIELCDILEKNGDLDKLRETLAKAKSQEVFSNDIKYYEALLCYREKKIADALTILEEIDIGKISVQKTHYVYHLKAQCLDKSKNYREAFSFYKNTNNHILKSSQFNSVAANNYLSNVNEVASQLKSAPSLNNKVNFAEDVDTPLSFLIGFPRSGTTLLDTILRGHPKVSVIEEQNLIGFVRGKIGSNLSVNQIEGLKEVDVSRAREIYFKERRKYIQTPSSNVIIDKLPLNIVHLPLIHRLFPDAKLLYSLRHPCDVILSSYFQRFSLNPAMSNLLEMDRCAEFYCSIMEIFHQCENRYELNIQYIRYEKLIYEFEETVGKVLNFLNLNWDESVLDYQKTAVKRDRVNTPSYDQVISPLYTESVERWRNYRDEIEENLKKITPWVKHFRYQM